MSSRCQTYLCLTVVLLTTSVLSELLYNGARLSAFSKPDFRTSFRFRSNNGSSSFREVYTGQNQRPFHVRVYAKVLNGVNAGFCFEGVGAAQVSARKSGHSYGGLIFAYNSNYVRIWAPSLFRNNSNGRIIFVRHGWGGEKYSQRAEEALVVVEVWNIGPVPTFQTNILVDISFANRVFFEVKHELAEIPERVLVRVTPLSGESRKRSPNYGYWFNGISSSQNVEEKGYGGVIFAYNQKKIQLWLPKSGTRNTGCVYVKNGWGGEQQVERASRCMVYIFAWVMNFPVPSFTTNWKSLNSQGRSPFLEIRHSMNMMPSLVIVQGRSDINKGLIFEGTGAVMSTDSNLRGYGGILFAYDKNVIRIWVPKRYNGAKDGYSILVNGGWGNDRSLMSSHHVNVRVLVYTSNCDTTQETVIEKGVCQKFKYNSYHWQTGPWYKCSSICNRGVKHREITGCEVSTSETVLSCGFEKDHCAWQSIPASSWHRVKDQRPPVDLRLEWNRPDDSHYIFAVSNSSDHPVVLASPKLSGRDSCTLSFNYKMFGDPPPVLSVHVSMNNRPSEPSGWSMQDNQGGLFWRRGLIKLTKFRKLTQVFFKFALSLKPENHKSASSGNVSLNNVKLECESVKKKTVDTEVCQKRKIHSVGCIHRANEPTTRGPAYELTNINNQNYVIASGQIGKLIASYEFMVRVAGEYSIWLRALGTSKRDNGVSFRIDNSDNYPWHTTYIDEITRAMWAMYLYETFYLMPGLHTIYLSQFEENFKFSHILLTPKRLLTWAPLGIQSRYIPDSHFKAFPPSSFPAPKYGRLNGMDAWCSSDHNPGYVRLEITLPELALVSRIAVQGGQQIQMKTSSYWVTEFRLRVSVDGVSFSWYRVAPNEKKFVGNKDASGIVEHELPFAVLAKKIQIYPYSWKNWICMRVELYGLYISSSMCSISGQESPTTELCNGDRNCSRNADCKPLTKDSILKTRSSDPMGRQACHCHTGFHGGSCQHFGCDPSPCENGGTCEPHPSNFTCSCPIGYHGPVCQHPCPLGRYGKDCVHRCDCGEHGTCSSITGHCSCEAGYYGGACGKVCPRGYFGDECKQRCKCENNGDCDHVTGLCTCVAGWMGLSCSKPCMENHWGIQCRKRCQCSENAISCNRITGECICKPGETGQRCDQSCPLGKYGSQCTGTCTCSNYGTCDKVGGNCTCHVAGWTGLKCDQPCPKGFFGIGCRNRCSCPGNAECNATSGHCMCASGLTGSACHLPCSKNKWGPGCENECQCVNGACNGVTGACVCPAAWRGSLCSNNCTDGTWGITCNDTCDCRNNASCDSLTGICQCQPGWTGSKCEKPCQTGFYGPRCESKCPCVHGNSCEPTTGDCLCPPGWLGRSCAEACPSGFYGDGCSKQCSCSNGSTCDHVTGACTCTAGWTGHRCSRRCSSGFYGNECSRECQCSRNNFKHCDHVTGRCRCKDGYVGVRCGQSCNPGYFGKSCKQKCRCQNGGECLSSNGKCLCLAGYYGDLCERRCPAMRYGISCSQNCSACTHSQESTCSPITGKCICSAGYYGYHCENRCPEGKYGLACASECACQNGAHCHHVNGSCECAEGFTGVKCDKTCPEGTFGNKCLGVCLCENGGSCDKVNGECSCLAGYQGTQCMDVCPKRRWGIECRNKCNCAWNHTMKCRGDTGACECRAGYRGITCEKFCDDGTYGQDCQHPCPRCSRHVTGTCYKIDGRCPCSPGYRGHMCDNDCLLKNFGANCGQRCDCKSNDVCHHVDGKCYNVTAGRFRIIIVDKLSDMDDIQRQKQIKLHMASIISANYYKYLETLKRLSRRETPTQSPRRSLNTTVSSSASSAYVTPSASDDASSPSPTHDFVARILDLSPGRSSDRKHEVVIISMAMFDGTAMLNGSVVKDVIDSIDKDKLTEIIGSTYYSGSLYSESPGAPSVYIQWITGVAGGLLLVVIVVIMFMMYRRRRRHLKTLKKQRKKEKEAETEMELKTRSFRHNGYRLAFDNPYYDVLAAMALDDDIEEDYINPLCDLESLMSHQGSDATVSSATECSIHKGESLQSVSYC